MRVLTSTLTLLTLLVLGGCTYEDPHRTIFDDPVYYTPTPEELQLADIGPLPPDFQERIRAFNLTRLGDAVPGDYRFREPRRGYEPGRTRADTIFCWIVVADVPVKDPHGEDAGVRTTAFHILQGTVIDADDLSGK